MDEYLYRLKDAIKTYNESQPIYNRLVDKVSSDIKVTNNSLIFKYQGKTYELTLTEKENEIGEAYAELF